MSSLITSFDLSVYSRRILVIGCLLSFYSVKETQAGFTLISQDLFNLVAVPGPAGNDDFERLTDILNPLQTTSTAQVGENIASSTYDFSWIEEVGIGDFNTTFSHAMRNSPGIRSVTNVTFFVETEIDLVVTLSGSLDYSHTPGDETQFLFGASIRDLDTSALLFSEGMEGGNADLLPASGTLSFDGSVVLPAGGLYRFLAVLDADDLAEPNPGIYDANGFANISIRPVPEPQTLLLVLFGGSTTILRRPR